MTSTIELTEQHQELIDELYFISDDDTDNSEAVQKRLEAIQGKVESRINWLSSVLLECKMNTLARKEAKDRATKRLATSVNAEARIKDYITQLMNDFNIKKLECDECTLTKQKGRETVFFPVDFDYMLLDSQYKKIVPEIVVPDKNAISKALKAGEEVCDLGLLRGADFVVLR